VLTTDCPVGVRRKRAKQAAVAVGVSLLAGAGAALSPSQRRLGSLPDVAPMRLEPMSGGPTDRGAVVMGVLAEPDGLTPSPRPRQIPVKPSLGCEPPYKVDPTTGKKQWKAEWV
jgi:hypothetical protein